MLCRPGRHGDSKWRGRWQRRTLWFYGRGQLKRKRERETHLKSAQGISGIWAVAAIGVSLGLEQMTLESRASECV